jgi:mRNA interferase RelE/StbE
MAFSLEFKPSAWKEWQKLDSTIKIGFKKRLKKVLEQPRLEANRLSGLPDCYKIKLRTLGYRLVYQVNDGRVVVLVLAVGKREKSIVYKKTKDRL